MTQPKATRAPTFSRTLKFGAGAGIGLTFIYASMFALYAVCRSSLTIGALTPPDISLFGTLAANAASINLASLATASLLALPMALLGMGTAVAIKWFISIFNPNRNSQRAMLIGLAVALGVVLAFQFSMQMLLGRPLNDLGVETYLFWFGLPGVLHMGAGAVGAWYLNHTIANVSVVTREVNHGRPEIYSGAG